MIKRLLRGSKLYSILFFKCPRCHRGAVFKDSNPYKLSRIFKMYENCSHCGLHYEIEPNFFYGSMYVSYGYAVAVFVATYVIMNIFGSPGVWDVVQVLAIVMLIAVPLVFRLSRITWLNLFVKYNPDKKGRSLK